MLRISLTADDLARIRIAPAADPMWELLHSLHVVGSRFGEIPFGRWRHRCRQRTAGSLGLLTELAPPQGYSPDFLTPAAGTIDLAAGIETVQRTSRAVVQDNLMRLSGSGGAARALAGVHASTMRELGRLLHRYFDLALRPYWPQIHRQINEELLRSQRTMATGGVDRLLTTLCPQLRWEPPFLVLVGKRLDRDIHLDGRGLVLQPSFFAYDDVTLLQVPDMPMVLAYPIQQDLSRWSLEATSTAAGGSLEPMLGRTRARALEILATGELTTSALATRLGLSVAAASQQTTILRGAGLVSSAQHGKAVVHRATELGRQLLIGAAVH